ncbi:MAG: aldehyde ferredoxin oxidoreductase family protein [Desulfobacterales bacterium]|nr:MAG: aldehyde ferredoxin oxidoreductase family protein [Desulfobacterales bacterium]
MYGCHGKILSVDLSRGRISVDSLDPQVVRDYVGGRGLGIYFLNQLVDPRCDPLSPDNILVMTTGPLTGTLTPTGARYMVTTKSPLTGAITCSNSGGQFPKELKRSGFDGLIVSGKSSEPTYLWVDNGRVELRPASHLWDLTVPETTNRLLAETDFKARVACIGPAGEKGVLFASIMNDKDRAAGRSGVGAVMGSKNLKAVVVRGHIRTPLADKKRFEQIQTRVMTKFTKAAKAHPSPLSQHGTAGVMIPLTQKHGVLPTKNYQLGTFEGWQAISGQTLTEKYLQSASACWACPIACGRVTKVMDKEFAGEGEGPEFETTFALGSMCMVDNLAAVTKANYICNELGMDTITMGVTIACAMELYDRGIIDNAQTGGPIRWGDAARLVELTQMTGYREGFGAQLAEGSYRLAARYGHSELAMVSKKLELPGYDPRGLQAQGVAYATSPIGGSHCRAHMAYTEMVGIPEPVDRHERKGKGRLVKRWQDVFSLIDAAGICIMFAVRNLLRQDLDLLPEGILEYLNASTGVGYTLDELLSAGERIFNAERLFLVRAGFSRHDDTLPKRLLQEPLPEGPSQGGVVHLEQMMVEYYKARGWTREGFPTAAKLKELGLPPLDNEASDENRG